MIAPAIQQRNSRCRHDCRGAERSVMAMDQLLRVAETSAFLRGALMLFHVQASARRVPGLVTRACQRRCSAGRSS